MSNQVKLKIRMIFLLCYLLLSRLNLYAKQVEIHPEKTISSGNFELPYSQQPWPFVSFGENILDQGLLQGSVSLIAYLGNNNLYTLIDQNMIYGITDDLSVLLSVPISPQNIAGSAYSYGLNDITAQLEYAFFHHEGRTYAHDATVVGNVTYPSGTTAENPPTGFGAMTFFLGATYNYTGLHWVTFLSSGGIFTTNLCGKRQFGDQFFYQFGLGRSVASPKKTIFSWLVEVDGTYAWKINTHGIMDPNSGGNVIYVTPSISAATEHLIVQFGVGYPVIQDLNGNQTKYFWTPQMNLAYTF